MCNKFPNFMFFLTVISMQISTALTPSNVCACFSHFNFPKLGFDRVVDAGLTRTNVCAYTIER